MNFQILNIPNYTFISQLQYVNIYFEIETKSALNNKLNFKVNNSRNTKIWANCAVVERTIKISLEVLVKLKREIMMMVKLSHLSPQI